MVVVQVVVLARLTAAAADPVVGGRRQPRKPIHDVLPHMAPKGRLREGATLTHIVHKVKSDRLAAIRHLGSVDALHREPGWTAVMRLGALVLARPLAQRVCTRHAGGPSLGERAVGAVG